MGMDKLLVLADTHSNLEALEAVLEDAGKHGPFKAKLCAGDLVGYGPNPNEAIERIRDEGFITVSGNHDRAVRGSGAYGFNDDARDAVEHNKQRLNPGNMRFLYSLSKGPYVDPQGIFAMIHSTFDPKEFEDTYIDSDIRAVKAMNSLVFNGEGNSQNTINVPLGIIGHTHVPMHAYACIEDTYRFSDRNPFEGIINFNFIPFDINAPDKVLDLGSRLYYFNLNGFKEEHKQNKDAHFKLLFNPGSVGQPRHGSYAASYGIVLLGDGNITLEFRNVQYDVEKTQEKMRRDHMPEKLVTRLAMGR